MNMQYFVSTHDEGRTAPMCIDVVGENGKGLYGGLDMEAQRAKHPNVVLMTADEFQLLQETACVTDPALIDEDRFVEMLECLPPVKWNNRGPTETFMMSEFMTGRITGIYCRIGKVYFSFYGVCSLSHDEIVAKCLATRDALNVVEAPDAEM